MTENKNEVKKNLHSNMDRLKHEGVEKLISKKNDLHSNMDRLKQNQLSAACFSSSHLHSNMDRLKHDVLDGIRGTAAFTFQYG